MIAEIAAARDRLLWEGALVHHLLALIPPRKLDATVPDTGWSVRQTLAHLGFANERHARILGGIRAGEPAPPFITAEENAAQVAPASRIAAPALRELLGGARESLRARLADLDESMWRREARPGQPVAAMVRHWLGHYAEHTWHILDVVPDVRFDPLIANWLLYVDYEGDGRPEFRARQERLVEDFRALLADGDNG